MKADMNIPPSTRERDTCFQWLGSVCDLFCLKYGSMFRLKKLVTGIGPNRACAMTVIHAKNVQMYVHSNADEGTPARKPSTGLGESIPHAHAAMQRTAAAMLEALTSG